MRNQFLYKIARNILCGFQNLVFIFLKVVNCIRSQQKCGAHNFIVSKFDTKCWNRGIKYLHIMRNLQYTCRTIVYLKCESHFQGILEGFK